MPGGVMNCSRRYSLIAVVGVALLASSYDARADGARTDAFPLYQFLGQDDGEYPQAGLVTDGVNLYGTTFGTLANGTPGKNCSKTCGTVYGIVSAGRTAIDTLHSFSAGNGDGAFPTSEVAIQSGSSGTMFYGTTEYGTAEGCGGLGCGIVYQFSASDTTDDQIFRFCQQINCTDGVFPHAGLTIGLGGNLYGTTTFGGTGKGDLCGSSFGGCGVVYEFLPQSGQPITPIYSFCKKPKKNVCVDGAVPYGGLIADNQGNLYGTTEFGGAYLSGTIFVVTPSGQETVLYSFCKRGRHHICPDGAFPQASLIAYNGNLYGTAANGGVACAETNQGCGVVFKIAPSGSGYTVLYRFAGGNDGSLPKAPLAPDGAGNLYGTTYQGGGGVCSRGDVMLGCGTLFELSVTGTGYQILHAFNLNNKNNGDGAHPQGALAILNGVLYGATGDKGDMTCSCGTLYSVDIGTAGAKTPR